MRISAGLGRGLVTFPIRVFAKMKLRALSYKVGIQISPGTKIGEGLYIGHGMCLVTNPKAEIGKNVNLSLLSACIARSLLPERIMGRELERGLCCLP